MHYYETMRRRASNWRIKKQGTVLQFTKISLRNAGYYRCIARFAKKTIASREAFVMVQGKLTHVDMIIQGWTLTYFETCPVGQVRIILTCPN